MLNQKTLTDIKNELKRLIRNQSDRGFLPYSACNRVCLAMITIVEDSLAMDDSDLSLDIHLYILLEAIKLISYADTSSGMVTDVVHNCLDGIEEFSKTAPDDKKKNMFNKIIKSTKHKAFQEWEEYGYQLLRSTVHLVQDQKQAETVYDMFSFLGPMYDGKEYPDRFVITEQIIERLDGAEAANQYRMEHIHIPEIRKMVVERAISNRQYAVAESLCLEALQTEQSYGRPPVWAFYLATDRRKYKGVCKLINRKFRTIKSDLLAKAIRLRSLKKRIHTG